MSELDLAELISRNALPNFVRIGETQYGIAFGAHHDGTNWVADATVAVILLTDLSPDSLAAGLSGAPLYLYQDNLLVQGQSFVPSLRVRYWAVTTAAYSQQITGPAGTTRALNWMTGLARRWALSTGNEAESGGNVGSDLKLFSISDADATLTTIWQITRAGVVTINAAVTWNAGGKFYPPKDGGTQQSNCALYAGTGAPNNANGANGDIYFRADGGALTTVYQKRVGVWTGIV